MQVAKSTGQTLVDGLRGAWLGRGVPRSLSCRRMPSPSDPLLLWCSSHESLAAEEIPLFLEAGFRVVLPPDVVRALQAVRICRPDKHPAFSNDDLALLMRHVDAVYVTVFPNVAIRLAEEFRRTVMFRAFGQAGLNTYSRIAAAYGAPPALVLVGGRVGALCGRHDSPPPHRLLSRQLSAVHRRARRSAAEDSRRQRAPRRRARRSANPRPAWPVER